MNWCAVDTGSQGAFAWVDNDMLGPVFKAVKIPKDQKELFQLINDIPHDNFIVEAIRMRPNDFKDQQFVTKEGKTSNRQFAAYRKIEMIKNQQNVLSLIELAGKKHILVEPRMWQKVYLGDKKVVEYQDRKKKLKTVCMAKFKKTKVVGWNADALLILDWIFRQIKTRSDWLRRKKLESNIK